MVASLILIPLIAAAIVAASPSDRWRPWLLPLGSAAHLVVTYLALFAPADQLSQFDGWLVLDPLGKVFLGTLSLLHFLCMCYAPAYLRLRPERSNRLICTCMMLSLSVMTLVVVSHHLGLMWVAVEASTLVSAPALYFNHNPRSLEATWKYLLLCSVGIALALFGSFFLAYSALYPGLETTLLFDSLIAQAPNLSKPWLHAAFVLLFVGYGTKMGLSPMHTWKPDAYGESPGLVGALLAGGITNCAFFAILRCYHIVNAAGEGDFARSIMVFVGLLSIATAAVFMVRQRDVKRLLAYSSVEHMGILVLGVGIGGAALFGALLHVINNALTKGVLFLSAGNIHRAYGSKLTEDVHGVIRALPLSGSLLLAGFLAGCGSPPFGPFVSEFTIASAAFTEGNYVVAGLFIVALFVVFLGMGSTILSIVLGVPPERVDRQFSDGLRTGAPVLAFMALVVVMGLWIPPEVVTLLRDAADFLQTPGTIPPA